MPEVRLSPAALRKLDEAFDYIGTTLASPLAAQKTVDAVLDGLKVLERFPEIGPLVSSRLGNVPERFAKTRFIVCGSYNAVYEYDGDAVEVLALYHGLEDVFGRLLGEIR